MENYGIKLTLTQKQIGAFVSKESNRPAMTGVYVHDNKLIATDGFVLLIYPVQDEAEFPAVVLPVTAFPKKAGNVTFCTVNDDGSSVTVKEVKVTKYGGYRDEDGETRIVKLIPERFPNYGNVLPWRVSEGQTQPDRDPQELAVIGINPVFLAKFAALYDSGKTDGGGVKLTFYGPTSAIKVDHDEFTGLIMPTRV